jgi:aspartate racemase
MRKIGIVGGVSWPSTVEYYSGICRLAEAAHASTGAVGLAPMPEIAIESLDHRKAVALLGDDADQASWSAFERYHSDALRRIHASGADFALIASNTPHHRFSAIVRNIRFPVLNLFEELARQAEVHGVGSVLVLGTAVTMGSTVLREAFAGRGIAAAPPSDPAVRKATIKLIGDLHLGSEQGAKQRLDRIVERALDGLPGRPPLVCLACTELPLLFGGTFRTPTFERHGLTYLDSTQTHIEAAFQVALGRRDLKVV